MVLEPFRIAAGHRLGNPDRAEERQHALVPDPRRAREAPAAQSEALRRTLEEGPALDVRSETADGGEANAARQRAQQQSAGAEPAAGEPEDTTSRLLRAKKRAAGGDGSEGGPGGG